MSGTRKKPVTAPINDLFTKEPPKRESEVDEIKIAVKSEPTIPSVISKKIELHGKEIYVIRVFMRAAPLLKAGACYMYSAWEIQKPGVTYTNKDTLNGIELGQLGSQVVPDCDEIKRFRKEIKDECYQAISKASKEASERGIRRNCFVQVHL